MSEKIKILIVDDEFLERNLIRNCIDWKHLGMEIAAEASNALDALDMLETVQPDILFTDINMPITDGIRLSEMALQKKPRLKIVILTGYNDFDYAQKSLKIGVSDFLVKPIDAEEVYKTVSALKTTIESERKYAEEYEELHKQLYDNLPYMREIFFLQLLNGHMDIQSVSSKIAFLGLRIRPGRLQVAAIQFDEGIFADSNEKDYFIQNARAAKLVKKFFERNSYLIVCNDALNRIVLLNSDENMDLYEECEKLKAMLCENFGDGISIGLGSIKKQIEEICLSYREALDSLRYRVSIGNKMVIYYNHTNQLEKNAKDELNELNEKMSFYLKSGLESKSLDEINNYFKKINPQDVNSIKKVRIAAINLISLSLRMLMNMGIDSDQLFSSQMQLYNAVFSQTSLPGIVKFLNKFISQIIQKINCKQVAQMSKLMLDIQKYIDENLESSRLSLSTVAKSFYLNPSYLSRMFKKEMKVNFVEYLTKSRMEEAITLLKETKLKSFEIAEKIGIDDSNYFSTCFKKYTGLTVSEYKRVLSEGVLRKAGQ